MSVAKPIASMYGIFTYIYHTNQPFSVGKYSNPTDGFSEKNSVYISSTPGIGSCSALRLPAVYAWLKWMGWIIARTSAPGLDNQKGIGKEFVMPRKMQTYMEEKTMTCMYIYSLSIYICNYVYMIYDFS